MIPGTLLGALLLAAWLVPGFVFLRVGERRRARTARSALVEAVELAGVGAVTSVISVMTVLILGRWLNFLDAQALADDADRFLLLHPVRALGSVLATLGLSCLLASLAALAVFRKRESVFEPAGTSWARMFYEARPNDKPEVVATVELTDGRLLAGRVASFTSEMDDNRELALIWPLAASPNAATPVTHMAGDFIVIREQHIASITGFYADLGARVSAEAKTGGDETGAEGPRAASGAQAAQPGDGVAGRES